MINYLETVKSKMRELERRGGLPTHVPVPSPDLPQD